jgi:sugar phosphate isomerase/epimerase
VITYCSNIHAGESFEEIFHNLRIHLPIVKREVCAGGPFPVGLRLSNRAAMDVDEETSLRFQEWCRREGFFVATINGFPFGPFQNVPVKEGVYEPDWRSPERVAYTQRLAELLDSWLPPGQSGSISTVPVAFKPKMTKEELPAVRRNLLSVLEHLDGLRQRSGKTISLSLEPEPGCVLETTEEAVEFFEQMNFPDACRNLLGICYDCCHQAVEFEDPGESIAAIGRAGIKINKVHISSALRLVSPDRETLRRFCEPVYLHQTFIRTGDGRLLRFRDLPEALAGHPVAPGEEWRIHFHVPIFLGRTDSYGTTRFFIEEIIPVLDQGILLEVETYTWNVLPRELQMETVTQSIIREIQWLKNRA